MEYTRISSEPENIRDYLLKVWKQKNLIMTFAKRDLKVKYAQTIIGLGWTIIQPLTAIIVYTLFFDFLLDIKSDGSPYVLFVFSGLACWMLFSYIFLQASTSLIQNQELIRKLYFPKILLPISKSIVALVEFSVSVILLLVVMIIFKTIPGWKILLIIFPVAGIVLIGLSISFFLCAVTIRNRDLQYLVPFFVNFGIWFTPVFYPVSILPEKCLNLIYINPVAGFIEIFRWCLGLQNTFQNQYLISIVVTLLLLFISIIFFIRSEDSIADKI
jgi:lipopolysaccharide transport system permease protein